jgi:hypothetical protein
MLGVLACTYFVTREGADAAVDPAAAANELVALTNVSRTSNGLPALPRDGRLAAVSVARSEDMLTRNYFDHYIPPDNRTVVDILESLGVRFRAAGENIEFNDALDFTSVQVAGSDFMNSPSHRANMLDRRWERLGAGVGQSGNKKMYTVIFMESGLAAAGETALRPVFAAEPRLSAVAQLPPPTPRARGERVDVEVASGGLIDSLVNRLLRLFLNL